MNVKYDFSGKVALVTGAASGMGRSVAEAFGVAGANVVVADISAKSGGEVVEGILKAGGQACFAEVDVASAQSVKAMVETAVMTFGRLDYAFNNAAIEGEVAKIHEVDEAVWARTIAVNQTGVFLCLKYEIQQFLKQGSGGAIVNSSSTNGVDPTSYMSPYNASKAAVLLLTRTAALEYATAGIRINAIIPGSILTPMLERGFARSPVGMREQMENYSPMRRLGEPKEIAEAVLWLCSDGASYVHGVELAVDGGHLAGTSELVLSDSK